MKHWLIAAALIGVFLWVFVPKAVSWSHIKPPPARLHHRGVTFGDIVRASFGRKRRGTSGVRPSASGVRSNGGPVSIIRRVSEEYGVPAGALYGIWKKESGGLRSGWGSGPDWYPARQLSRTGSTCMRRYGKRCRKQWKALVRICDQRRRDGRKVCDPQKVRTSYAMAMGPMQHMPAEIITIDADGKAKWSSRAVDEDHDGVVDPDDLADAMGMTAKFLRSYYEAKVGTLGTAAAWRWAVNRYYGSQHAGYYSGKNGRRGVASYWKAWCSRYGCADRRTAFAFNDR